MGAIPDREQRKLFEGWLKGNLCAPAADRIRSEDLRLFGDRLYMLPSLGQDAGSFERLLAGVKVLRMGLHLGSFKKTRFEPAHAFALTLHADDVLRSINLALQSQRTEVDAWFRGEGIPASQEDDGWCLVCVDGYPAGWGKQSRRSIKNHYPKGLRRAL